MEGSARVGTGARATAAGLAQEFIYKRSLQSKFLSILTLLPPVVPQPPPARLLSRVLSVLSFVILAETLSTGEQNFLLLFPMPVQPLAQSQKHSRCLSKRPWRGRGESEGEGTSCVQLLFVLERGDRAPHHCQGRSLPSPAPSSLSASRTMGPLPKLALLDCPRLVSPIPKCLQ